MQLEGEDISNDSKRRGCPYLKFSEVVFSSFLAVKLLIERLTH